MEGRWTHHEEDSSRLPEGFRRIAYDADTKTYTFRDRNGVLYHGEPGMEYGVMTPIPHNNNSLENSRPSAFASNHTEKNKSTSPSSLQATSSTFQDILPPNLITTSSMSGKSPDRAPTPKAPRDQFVEAVRRSALPKMQGVVHSLRRSVTTLRKPQRAPGPSQSQSDGEFEGLVHRNTASTLGLERSASVSTARTDRSGASAITIRPITHS